MITHRPDSNHKIIIAHLRGVPALELIDTSQYGGLGCDCIILFREHVYFVEIKTDERSWKLTPSEERLQALCARTGCIFIIAEDSETVLRAIGAI